MTRVKICGIMREEDIRLCSALGVSALGFVVEYPVDVPWNLDRLTARTLMRSVPPFVSKVIVVGDDSGAVMELAEFLKPNVVQLHGSEPPSVTASLVASIKTLGIQVIKALRFSAETGRCTAAGEDPLDAARRLEDTGVDALVLDSVSHARPAGTGRPVNWSVAGKIRETVRIPVILAGGLNAGNVARAIAAVQPYGVDVISGVENPVGSKDPEKTKAFVEAVSGTMRDGP
jgi:phosphoribosylanthranilate isomerase